MNKTKESSAMLAALGGCTKKQRCFELNCKGQHANMCTTGPKWWTNLPTVQHCHPFSDAARNG